MESRQRPPLFENLIKDPPPQGLQAPISNEELEKINRYVERARRLKGMYCSECLEAPAAVRILNGQSIEGHVQYRGSCRHHWLDKHSHCCCSYFWYD